MNLKKYFKTIIVFFLIVSIAGCSKEASTNDTSKKKEASEEIIEMTVEELSDITSDLEKSKQYEDKKIKVKGYYWLYINLERDISTKYIQDNPVDANYSVELNDHGLLTDNYIGGEELELIGRIAIDGSLVDFYIINATVDGKTVGINGSNKNQTIKVTNFSDFCNNLDYYQGTEVTLYCKIIQKPLENYPNQYSKYLADVETGEELEYEIVDPDVSDLIQKGNPYAIITLCYRKSLKVGGLTSQDESKNIYHEIICTKVIEKTDNIKVKEKKKKKKDYKTVVTPEELCKNFEKYDGKIITLDGYGYLSGYYDGHDEHSVQYIMADESGKYQVRVFSKIEESKEKYSFSESYKFAMKGTPKKNDQGYIYMEVDQN